MAESGAESNLSDFSEGEDREQIDKENQLALNTENQFRSSIIGADHEGEEEEDGQQIFEQQQFQRQQFYSQQRLPPPLPASDSVHQYAFVSSPELNGRNDKETPSPMEGMETRPMNKDSGESGSDSDSSSSKSCQPRQPRSPLGKSSLEPSFSNDLFVQTVPLQDARSDNQSPTMLMSLSVNSASIDNTTNASESQEAMQCTLEPVSEYLVDRIDQEKWPGVNGDYDSDGQWREWQDMTTAVNIYSGDIVNILPYVNISC